MLKKTLTLAEGFILLFSPEKLAMSGTGVRTRLCNRSKISLQPETREILGYRFRCNQEKRRIVFDHVGKEPCKGPVITYVGGGGGGGKNHGVGRAYLF